VNIPNQKDKNRKINSGTIKKIEGREGGNLPTVFQSGRIN
jgi:hypothetical protein